MNTTGTQQQIIRAAVEFGGYELYALATTEAEARKLLGRAVRKFAKQNDMSFRTDWADWYGLNVETISLGHAFVQGHDGTPYI